MTIEVLKSKIHTVTVTGADLNYVGSVTIDEDLIDAAGLVEINKTFLIDPVDHHADFVAVACQQHFKRRAGVENADRVS